MTSTEGGVINTDDDFAKRLRILRFHGVEADAFVCKMKGSKSHGAVMTPGCKYNVSDTHSALVGGNLPA